MSRLYTAEKEAIIDGMFPEVCDYQLAKSLPQEFRLECCTRETRTGYSIILEKQEGYCHEALAWHCTVEIHGHYHYVGKARGADAWRYLSQSAVKVAGLIAERGRRAMRLNIEDWK